MNVYKVEMCNEDPHNMQSGTVEYVAAKTLTEACLILQEVFAPYRVDNITLLGDLYIKRRNNETTDTPA